MDSCNVYVSNEFCKTTRINVSGIKKGEKMCFWHPKHTLMSFTWSTLAIWPDTLNLVEETKEALQNCVCPLEALTICFMAGKWSQCPYYVGIVLVWRCNNNHWTCWWWVKYCFWQHCVVSPPPPCITWWSIANEMSSLNPLKPNNLFWLPPTKTYPTLFAPCLVLFVLSSSS